jgi:tetratricopeptide (TPR) repeat protein
LRIYERVKGKESFICAKIIKNIGNVYKDQGKLNKAIEFYKKALTIFEKERGK